MPLSIVYGTAFEVEPRCPVGNYRLYHRDGRTFMGHDTLDIVHVCDLACAAVVLPIAGLIERHDPDRTGHDLVQCGDNPDAFVGTEPKSGRDISTFSTADVLDFDPGDDPYVLCANCGAELLRDDDRFLAMFGHPITGPAQ